MKKRKVYIVGNSKHYSNFIDNHERVRFMNDADLVIFTGGEDITPELYGHEANIRSHFSKSRDKEEMEAFNKAKSLSIPMLGICRGSQLLTVLSGGKLIQHVNGHSMAGTHEIRFPNNDNRKLFITSTHHQMMNPFGMDKEDYDLIAVSGIKRSDAYEQSGPDDQAKNMEEEPEIVYYKNTNALAIQGHPEYMDFNSNTVIEINGLINKYLLK